MRAVGYQNCLPIDNPAALVDIELAEPKPWGGIFSSKSALYR
jgi:hypothetical protein